MADENETLAPEVDPTEYVETSTEDVQSTDTTEAQDTVPDVPAETPARQQEFDWREEAQKAGIDLSGYTDDSEAIRDFAQKVHRAQQVEQYLAYQQAQQQPEPSTPEEPKFFNPPEYDPAWQSKLKRDETTGQIVPDYQAGGTPDMVQKFLNWHAYQQSQQEQFFQAPDKYMAPVIEHYINQKVPEILEQRLSQVQQEQKAQTFLEKNADWLYEKDGAGKPLMRDGQKVLSQEGRQFSQYLKQAQELPPEQIALTLIETNRQAQRPNGQPDKKAEFLQAAAQRQPSASASTNQTPGPTGETPPQNANATLAERLRAAFANAGIKDDDL